VKFRSEKFDLGGGEINIGRVFTGSTLPAVFASFDMLTVAKHEIGHILGFNTLF